MFLQFLFTKNSVLSVTFYSFSAFSSTTKTSLDCHSSWSWRIPSSDVPTWLSSLQLLLFSANTTCRFSWIHCHCSAGQFPFHVAVVDHAILVRVFNRIEYKHLIKVTLVSCDTLSFQSPIGKIDLRLLFLRKAWWKWVYVTNHMNGDTKL